MQAGVKPLLNYATFSPDFKVFKVITVMSDAILRVVPEVVEETWSFS